MNAVDEYVRLARSWGDAMEEGDSELANELYDRIDEKYREIRGANRESDLFDRAGKTHDAASFFIASHVKEVDPFRARLLYERLAHSPLPFIAMSAERILTEMAPGGS